MTSPESAKVQGKYGHRDSKVSLDGADVDSVDQDYRLSPSREAQVLLDALEGYIRITTQNHTQGSDEGLALNKKSAPPTQASDSPGSTPSGGSHIDKVFLERHTSSSSRPEARALLKALETFIQSNIPIQLAHEGTQDQESDENIGMYRFSDILAVN
ncbi:hypothetical protein BDZ97DRAFT_1282150 [Flammula alnicola]|nr:hypothetical protein BDZ97DRAFT_1282150 [Flammula alnicola]